MEQEYEISGPSLHGLSSEQPSQTLSLDNLSKNNSNAMITEDFNSQDPISPKITELLKYCDFQQALESMELELDSQQKKFGENSINLVPLLNLMAETYISLGKLSIASEISQRCEQILIAHQEDPRARSLLAHLYQNIAMVSKENLQYKQALETIETAHTINLELYPADSPKNIEIYRVKALVLRDLKRYKEALEEIEKSVEIVEKSMDIIDPTLAARVYNSLGYLHRIVSDTDKARRSHEKALEICEKSGYDSHIEVAKAHVGIGSILNREDEGEDHGLAALKLERCFGDAHPERILAYLLLAEYYMYKARKSTANVRKYTHLAVEESEKIYGVDSVKTRDVCLQGARIAQGTRIADDLVRGILKISLENKSQEELKELCVQKCEAALISEEIELFNETYEVAEQVYDPVSLEMAEIEERKAVFCLRQKDGEGFMVNAKRSLEIKKKIFGDDHLDVAAMYILFAKRFVSKKKFQEAINYVELATTIRSKFYGEVHAVVIQSYNFLVSLYNLKNDYQTSIRIHFKILGLQEKLDDPNIYDTYESIGMAYIKFFDAKTSDNYFRKSYQLARVKLGANDSQTIDTKEFCDFGDEDRALSDINYTKFI